MGIAAVSALIGLAAVAPANATTENVGGGVWNHYFTTFTPVLSISNYNHPTKQHRASVDSHCPDGYHTSAWTQPYVIAGASDFYCYLGGNKAYWATR